MSAYRQKLGFLALVAALSLPCAAQTTPRPRTHGKDVRTGVSRKGLTAKPAESQRPEQAVAAPVSTPPPPSRPYELAPVAPQVTYTGGQLTISANNSTLADILNAVKSRTGAKMDLPPSAAQERVAMQLGPGNPRDVLAQLLHGSPFDYILLGSDQDPSAVTQIMLTRRVGGGAASVASGNIPNRAPRQPEPADEDAADNEPPPPVPPPPASGVPGQMLTGPPGMQHAPEQNAPNAQPVPGPPVQPGQENQVKTPEQLLQELQRMQREEQQRRQRPPR